MKKRENGAEKMKETCNKFIKNMKEEGAKINEKLTGFYEIKTIILNRKTLRNIKNFALVKGFGYMYNWVQ